MTGKKTAATPAAPEVDLVDPEQVDMDDLDDDENDNLTDEEWLSFCRFGQNWDDRDAIRASVLASEDSLDCVIYRLFEVDGEYRSIELGEGKALLHHQIDYPGKTAFDSLFTYQIEFIEDEKKDTRLKRDDSVLLLIGYNCVIGFEVEDFRLGEFGTLCDLWRNRACDSIPGVTDAPEPLS